MTQLSSCGPLGIHFWPCDLKFLSSHPPTLSCPLLLPIYPRCWHVLLVSQLPRPLQCLKAFKLQEPPPRGRVHVPLQGSSPTLASQLPHMARQACSPPRGAPVLLAQQPHWQSCLPVQNVTPLYSLAGFCSLHSAALPKRAFSAAAAASSQAVPITISRGDGIGPVSDRSAALHFATPTFTRSAAATSSHSLPLFPCATPVDLAGDHGIHHGHPDSSQGPHCP